MQAHHDGLDWGEMFIPVTVGVAPFFQDQFWIRGIGLLLAALAVFLLHRARVRFLHRHNRELSAEVDRRRDAEQRAHRMGLRALHAQEDERKRIAHELHDEIGQQMALLVLQIQSADSDERRTRCVADARKVGREIQRISHVLHPAWVETVGLGTALESLTAQVAEHSRADVEVRVSGAPPALGAQRTVALYRIAQEALSNAVRYSGATKIGVSLRRADDTLELAVRDNGNGFDPATADGGLGLVGMRERARAIGGEFTIDSAPQQGAAVRVAIELSASEKNGHASSGSTTP